MAKQLVNKMGILKLSIMLGALVHLSSALTPPSWYMIVGGTWDYVDWCKNPECNKLLGENMDATEKHSGDDLTNWKICKEYYNRMEKSLLNYKGHYESWNTTELVYDLIKSSDFCDFQRVEEEWERENFNGHIHTPETSTTDKPIQLHASTTSRSHTTVTLMPTIDSNRQTTIGWHGNGPDFHNCEESSTTGLVVTIVVLVIFLLISFGASVYLFISLQRAQNNYQSGVACSTLLDEF